VRLARASRGGGRSFTPPACLQLATSDPSVPDSTVPQADSAWGRRGRRLKPVTPTTRCLGTSLHSQLLCRTRASGPPATPHDLRRAKVRHRRHPRSRASPGTETNFETSLRQTHLRLTFKPPLVKHLPLKPQLVEHTAQFRIRVRLGVGAARILPPPVAPPILRPIIWGSPILRPKDQQLRRSRHRRGRFPVHRHYGTHSHNPRFTCTSPRSTSSMSPSSESGGVSTHACRATCQRRNGSAQDAPSSGANHSSRRNLSSSPGVFTPGGRRCIANVTTPLVRRLLEVQRACRSPRRSSSAIYP